MHESPLDELVPAARELIDTRFPDPNDVEGAAAMLLDDGTILTSTSPEAINFSVQFCHELGAFAEAHKRGMPIVASACVLRESVDRYVILSPCGVCMERLITHGRDVRVAVPEPTDYTKPRWVPLRDAHPHYWRNIWSTDHAHES